jgi:hypothetical protein
MWKKGQSGNPKGRPKTSLEAQATIRDLALGDFEAAYARLRVNALEEGETAACLKILALAGVRAEAEAVIQIEAKVPAQNNPYAGVSTDELLKRAGTSTTLSS